jgi:monofunctional biosynthetic peptidoglycan transglycosylase
VPSPLPPPRSWPARLLLALAALALAGTAAVGALWVVLPDPGALAQRNPPTTALIEQRKAEAARKKQRYRPVQAWVPLERVSKRLITAVIASEDGKFWEHGGFDWAALRDAARHDLAKGRFARGASTISQQTAKNLWLGTEKSLLRKGKEALATAKLERALPKRRILAIYLNVAEWGVGVFGIEAGARHHLGVGAGSLTTAQSVLLASMLPAPRRVDLRKPAPWLVRRATGLLDRLRAEHQIGDDEHRSASAELARLLSGPEATDQPVEVPDEEDEGPIATPTPTPTAVEPQGDGTSGASTEGQADALPATGQGTTPPQE